MTSEPSDAARPAPGASHGTGKLHYMILCDRVSVAGGKKSLHGIFTRIAAGRFPCVHPSCALAIELSCPAEHHKLKLRVVDSGGEDILPMPPPIDLESRNPMGVVNFDITLEGLRFQRPGIFSFQVYLDDDLIGIRDFFVERMDLPEAPDRSEDRDDKSGQQDE